jgi:hypothetical protein
MSRLRIEHEGFDHSGKPIFVCYRVSGGIAAYGSSHEDAYSAFRELEPELLPLPSDTETESQIDDALDRGEFR